MLADSMRPRKLIQCYKIRVEQQTCNQHGNASIKYPLSPRCVKDVVKLPDKVFLSLECVTNL